CSRPHGLRLPPPQSGSIHHDLVTTASRKTVHLACWSSAGNGTAYPIACPNPHCRQCFRLSSTCSRPASHAHHPHIARPKASRPPSAPPSTPLNLHSRSCTVGTLPPAISCLGASRTPPVAARG